MTTATDTTTGTTIEIQPIGYTCYDYDTIYIYDQLTGRPIWWTDGGWNIDLQEDYDKNLNRDTETITNIYQSINEEGIEEPDDETYVDIVNEFLEKYGLKLGEPAEDNHIILNEL